MIERCEEAKTENAYRLFTKWMGLNLPDEKLMPIQKPKSEQVEKVKKVLNDWGLNDKPFILTQLRASSPIRTPRPQVWANIINGLIEKGNCVIITDSNHYKDGIDTFINEMIKDEYKSYNFV